MEENLMMMSFSSATASQLAAALRKGYCQLILRDKRIQRIRRDNTFSLHKKDIVARRY